MQTDEVTPEVDLRAYLRVLRQRRRITISCVFGLVAVSVLFSNVRTPRYEASAKLLLKPRSASSLFGNDPNSNVDPERSVETEIEVIKTQPVQELVRAKIGAAPPVLVRPIRQTDLITIRAESSEPERAALVANTYAAAYIDFRRKQAFDELTAASDQVQSKITDIQTQIDGLGPSTEATVQARRTTLISQLGLFQQRLNQLQVDSALASGGAQLVTPASIPRQPFEPTPLKDAVVAGILGLVLGIGSAFLLEYLDDSVKSKEDLERAVPSLSVIGVIPSIPDWRSRETSLVVSLRDPASPGAEAYRILRTSIQFLGIEHQVRVIQVTSPSAQEGKTTTLANLAVAFANSGLRTVAVCCDLRRPRLHHFFEMDNAIGFTSVLLGNVALSSALQPVPGQERLLILPSGPLPPNPAELLSSHRTAELLRNLAAQSDVVLIDSPPVLPVTDSIVLSQRVDSTVLVTSARSTTRKAARRATEMLHQVNAPLAGAILNNVTEKGDYGSYSYRYYTSMEKSNEAPRNGVGVRRRRDKNSSRPSL